MKGLASVLVKPLAARLGSMLGGGIAAWGSFDPTLSSRLEAWIAAGCFIAVDLIAAYVRNTPKQEGR